MSQFRCFGLSTACAASLLLVGCNTQSQAPPAAQPAGTETATAPAADANEMATTADSGEMAAEVTLVNAICPFSGKAVQSTVTAVWNDQTVGFCCEDCLAAWNELSDDEKSAKLAAADAGEETAEEPADEQADDTAA